MKAKDKAKELVDKYFDIIPFNDNELSEEEMYEVQLSIVKQCALISVDVKLSGYNYDTVYKYWKEVEYEINKL